MVDSDAVDISDLRSAVTGWVGKAALGVAGESDITAPLNRAHSLTKTGMTALENGNTKQAVSQLSSAEQTLKNLRDQSRWPGGHYYRCIYDGGDRSGYESGFYRGVPVSNTLEAIALAKELAYKDDSVLHESDMS